MKGETKMDAWIKAINEGREIVVVGNEMNYMNDDSAIFWKEKETIYSFTRHFGIMKRTDITVQHLAEHLDRMEKEGNYVFCRGIA